MQVSIQRKGNKQIMRKRKRKSHTSAAPKQNKTKKQKKV